MKLKPDSFPRSRPKDYKTFRSKILSGDILLCSGAAPFSKMIQKATESVWSHVGFVVRLDSIDRVMVLESVESVGVRTVPLSQYVYNYDHNSDEEKGYPGKMLLARHKELKNVTEKKLNKMSQFAVDLFGYPYDQQTIIRIAARIFMSRLGVERDRIPQDDAYICSEYAWRCYKQLGIRIPYNDGGFIAPSDFAADPNIEGLAVIRVAR